MRYTVVYGRAPNNYAAFVPMLPVVVVSAPTLAELEQEALSAIAFQLEDTDQAGAPIEVELVAHDAYTGPLLTLAGELVTPPVAPAHCDRRQDGPSDAL
jgi:predicted RNase H-like HicB family nuclease